MSSIDDGEGTRRGHCSVSGHEHEYEHGRERCVNETGPRNTNVPPPPKHKDNAPVTEGVTSEIPALPGDGSEDDSADERAESEAEIDAASEELAAAVLALAEDLARRRPPRRGRFVCVTESGSELGRDAHIQAVLRRIACGEPGAVLLDAHFVLTETALAEELAMVAQARRQKREDA